MDTNDKKSVKRSTRRDFLKAAAAGVAPEIDHRFRQPALGERAHGGERFRVRACEEVVEGRDARRLEVEGELAHPQRGAGGSPPPP